MLSNFASAAPKLCANELDWGLIWSTVVTGIVVVFFILAILVLFLWLFGKIFKAIGEAQAKKEKAKLAAAEPPKHTSGAPKAPAPSAASSPSQAAVTLPDDEDEYEEEDDEEIIAVIAAAIAAFGEAEGKQYRIASIKRPKNIRSGWSSAGLADNMRGMN